MALEDASGAVLAALPQEVIQNIGLLVTILQAAGLFFILYLIFNIINTFINRRRQKDIKHIAEDVSEIKKLLKKKR